MRSNEVDLGCSRAWLDYVLEHNKCIPLCMVVDISVCQAAFPEVVLGLAVIHFSLRVLNVRL